MRNFASCLIMCPGKRTFPKCRATFSFSLIVGPYSGISRPPILALSLTYFIVTGCYLISFRGWKGFQYPSLCQLINLLKISLCKRSCNMRKLFYLQLWDYFHECLISMEVFLAHSGITNYSAYGVFPAVITIQNQPIKTKFCING
jgi:hypothetical protein